VDVHVAIAARVGEAQLYNTRTVVLRYLMQHAKCWSAVGATTGAAAARWCLLGCMCLHRGRLFCHTVACQLVELRSQPRAFVAVQHVVQQICK
jgi:hypothetical protein